MRQIGFIDYLKTIQEAGWQWSNEVEYVNNLIYCSIKILYTI